MMRVNRADERTGLGVPEPELAVSDGCVRCDIIGAARDDAAAVGSEYRRAHSLAVTAQRAQKPPAGHIPDFDLPLIGAGIGLAVKADAGEHALAVRREGDRGHSPECPQRNAGPVRCPHR